MTMNMSIIMDMNIYITRSNEKFLRQFSDTSMSGLINKLLLDYQNGMGPDLFPDLNVETHDIEEPLKRTTFSESIKNTKPIIKTTKQAKDAIDNSGFITKDFSARKKK